MESKGERTRNEILKVARELFSKRGYKDVSMQDICNETGLSKGGVYRYFSNKGEILFELIKKEKRVEQDIKEGISAVQILENMLMVYREDMEKYSESLAYALFEYAASTKDSVIDSRNIAEKDHWHKLVDYGVRTGEFHDVNPDVVMDTFLYAYRGVMMWGRALTFESATFDHILEAVKLMLIKDYKENGEEM